MTRHLIAVLALATTPILGLAQAEMKHPNLSARQTEQLKVRGWTVAPNAKPEEGKGSLSDKAMKYRTGTNGPSTGKSDGDQPEPGGSATSKESSKADPGGETAPPDPTLKTKQDVSSARNQITRPDFTNCVAPDAIILPPDSHQ